MICTVREISTDDMAQIIKQNYKNLVECDWEVIQANLEYVPTQEEVPEDEEYDTYIYFKVHKDTLEVSISAITNSQYWSGESQSEYWVANMLIFKDTEKRTFLDFNCAGECNYYDDPECYDSKIIAFNGWYIPIENIVSAMKVTDEIYNISFNPRGIFSKMQSEEISKGCFNNLEENFGNELLVIKKS